MSNQTITLDGLEVLDAIDQKGSFAAAANILYKVPSAITYTVQKLEQDLGVTLFIKEGRNSVLTPAGRVLLEKGRDILAATQLLAETTREVHNGWESKLNIAIDTALGSDTIYPLLGEFFEIKPDIEINLYQEVLAGGWDALMEKRVDIALGMPTKPSNTNGLCCELFTRTLWVFAVHSAHPLAALKQPIDKEDIECHRAIVIRDSSRNYAKLTHRLFSKQPVLSVQSIQDKASAQKAGLGVGFVPKAAILDQLESGDMVQLDVRGVETNATHYLGWRRGEKGKALRWFVEKLKKQISIDSGALGDKLHAL